MIRASHTSLVLLPVQLDSRGVRQEEVVAGDVRLGGGVAAEVAAGAPGGGEVAVAVPVGGHHPGLVDGEPVLHTVTVCPKAKICEPREIVPAKCMHGSHSHKTRPGQHVGMQIGGLILVRADTELKVQIDGQLNTYTILGLSQPLYWSCST